MNDSAPVLILALALAGVSPHALASGMEVCSLAGVVSAVTSADSEATYFRLAVKTSRPVACLGWLSHEPGGCARYASQVLDVGLSTSEVPALAIGDRLELVQTVVDVTAGSQAGSRQVSWRSVRECESEDRD